MRICVPVLLGALALTPAVHCQDAAPIVVHAAEEPVDHGRDLTPPMVVYAPDVRHEEFPDKLSGHVLVYLQVGVDGTPSHLRVLRGIGHGRDEKALEAVAKYKFKPALRKGKPVRIEMNVDVYFEN